MAIDLPITFHKPFTINYSAFPALSEKNVGLAGLIITTLGTMVAAYKTYHRDKLSAKFFELQSSRAPVTNRIQKVILTCLGIAIVGAMVLKTDFQLIIGPKKYAITFLNSRVGKRVVKYSLYSAALLEYTLFLRAIVKTTLPSKDNRSKMGSSGLTFNYIKNTSKVFLYDLLLGYFVPWVRDPNNGQEPSVSSRRRSQE